MPEADNIYLIRKGTRSWFDSRISSKLLPSVLNFLYFKFKKKVSFLVQFLINIYLQDCEKETNLESKLKEVSVEEILDLQRREQESRYERNKLISKALKERGLSSNSEIAQDDAF